MQGHLNLSVAQAQKLEECRRPAFAMHGRGGAGSLGDEEPIGSAHGGVFFANFNAWAQFSRKTPPKHKVNTKK